MPAGRETENGSRETENGGLNRCPGKCLLTKGSRPEIW